MLSPQPPELKLDACSGSSASAAAKWAAAVSVVVSVCVLLVFGISGFFHDTYKR